MTVKFRSLAAAAGLATALVATSALAGKNDYVFEPVAVDVKNGSGTQLVLSDPYAGRSQADGDAIHELVVKGVLGMVVFDTDDDLDTVFERVRASGAEVLQEPKDQPWGPRDCAFRDPSGNMVRILQSTPQPQNA